jgi:uncharacterized RDD family membrane protein YckC
MNSMQNCHACSKEVGPDMFFCAWRQEYLGANGKGKKANLFSRWIALLIDPAIGLLAWLLPTALFAAASQEAALVFALVFPIAYFILTLTLFRRGLTHGKLLLGLQVVDQRAGGVPGFGKMFLREIVGRILSGLFLGLGYFWAVFDKNAQSWHDKLAGTVVIKRAAADALAMRAGA